MADLCAKSPSRLRNTRVRRFPSVGVDDIIENFWGVELNTEHPEEVWNFKVEDEEEDQDKKDVEEPDRDFMLHQLSLKMATLGSGLMKGEEHVVQVETVDKDGKSIKIPFINMVAGAANTMSINAEFTDKHKVIFRLIEGSGPVYLSGTCIQEFPDDVDSQDESLFTETEATATDEIDDSDEDDDIDDDDDDDDDDNGNEEEDDDDDEEDEEMEMEETKGKKGKAGVKRKSPSVKGSRAKQRGKLETKDDSDEASEEDDDEDDEEEEHEVPKRKGKANTTPKPGKSPKVKPGRKGSAAVSVSKAVDKKNKKQKSK